MSQTIVAWSTGAQSIGIGLHGRHAGYVRCLVAQVLVKIVGKYPPVILETAVDALFNFRPDFIKLFGMLDWNRSQDDLIDQRKDGGGRTNAKRQRKNGSGDEARCTPQLP